jgi:hypothetical protein
MNPKVKKILDKINDEGIESMLPFFNNNFEVLLNYLKWGNAIEELILDRTDLNNDFYLYLINNGYENKAMTEIIRSMGSVSHDGKDYFYEVISLDEMAEWFSTRGRDYSPETIASGVLSDNWEPFYLYKSDTDLMREVYDDLNKENQTLLRNIVVEKYSKDLIGVPSENVTDLIKKIGTEDENGDYDFYINNENVLDLFSEDETMNFLFKYYFEDLSDKLFELYSNSYNEAYINEYYYKVWGELKGEFIDIDAEPIEFKYGNRFWTKLKITNVLPRLIEQYLNNERCDDIDSLGDYMYLIREGIGCGVFDKLTFRIDDYPDSRELKRVLNENFREYF